MSRMVANTSSRPDLWVKQFSHSLIKPLMPGGAPSVTVTSTFLARMKVTLMRCGSSFSRSVSNSPVMVSWRSSALKWLETWNGS